MSRWLLFIGLALWIHPVKSQLANGAPAPDFTVTDINGNTYNLYSKMGTKGACVDFSVTWCMICWAFQQEGTLKNIYNNLSNYATTVFLEADFNTNTNCLYGPPGCVGGYQGDWVTGSPFPIVDLSPTNGPNVRSNYAISFFPTVYVISPDKRAWEVHSLIYQDFVNWLTQSFKLAASASLTHCNCGSNGGINLTVSGGYGSLVYLWSNGASTRDLKDIAGGSYTVTITDQNGYFKSFGPWNINNPPKRVDIINTQLKHVECYNEFTGSIAIQVAYGTPPYIYNWSNGKTSKDIANLKADTYVITITDNVGCTTSKYYTINQPTELVLSATTTKDECDQLNGSINAIASGGNKPYYFDLGSGIQQLPLFGNLTGGRDYVLTLTDKNLCTASLKVKVEATHKPKVDPGQAKSFADCSKDHLSLDGSNSSQGTAYTYLWTTTDGNILKGRETLQPDVDKAGKYVLKITDINSKCIDTGFVSVTDDRRYPNIKTEGDIILNCHLLEATLKGSSDSLPVIYYWQKADDSLFQRDGQSLIASDSGRFIFYVQDSVNFCKTKDTVYVQKDQLKPNASARVDQDVSCKNPEITIDASASSNGPNMAYHWTTANGTIIRGANTLMPLINKGGDYQLLVQNTTNYCEQFTTIHVRQQSNTLADFRQLINELKVQFEDQSVGTPTSWLWDFGDPSSPENNSIEKNPAHAYAIQGEYEICLRVENDCNIDFKCAKISVDLLAPLQVVSWDIQHEKCFGDETGSIKIIVYGGIPPYSFLWNNQQTTQDIQDLAAGDYSVEITDHQGGVITKSFTINQPPELTAILIEIINTLPGQHMGSITISISGGMPPYLPEWTDGKTPTGNQSLAAGDYYCNITDAAGCKKTVGPFTVKEQLTSTNNTNKNTSEILKFTLLPNPFKDWGIIDLQFTRNQKYSLDIITAFGIKLWNGDFQNANMSLPMDASSFPKGVYFVVLRTDRSQKIAKWVIE